MPQENFDAFALRLHPDDEVAVLKRTLKAGTELVNGRVRVTATKTIPAGHKIALTPIRDGAAVHRYGQIIGFAQGTIAPGDHVHTHNCAMRDFARDYAFGANAKATQYFNDPATFQGYVRADGRVATRNYIGVLTSVNCSATVAKYIADAFKRNPFGGASLLDQLSQSGASRCGGGGGNVGVRAPWHVAAWGRDHGRGHMEKLERGVLSLRQLDRLVERRP